PCSALDLIPVNSTAEQSERWVSALLRPEVRTLGENEPPPLLDEQRPERDEHTFGGHPHIPGTESPKFQWPFILGYWPGRAAGPPPRDRGTLECLGGVGVRIR